MHDAEEQCIIGDQVKVSLALLPYSPPASSLAHLERTRERQIRNCRPISARKRFELVSVVKGARERVESTHGPGELSPDSPAAPSPEETTA